MKILYERKQINEGPGAGYTIESSGYSLNGKLLKVKMTDIGSSIKFECDVDFTGTVSEFEASAYYTGTGKVHDLPISCSYVELEVSKDIAWNNELVDDDVTTYDEQQLLEEILDTLAGASCEFGYGGGYSHATYDGQVTDDYLSADYHDIKADIYLTNDEDIKRVDRMTNGYGYETLYEVVFDDVDDYEVFDDEYEAIEYAKSNNADLVRTIYQTELWDGDVDVETGDIVWTNDDIDEDWTTFKYKSGANPYIAKDEKETNRILNKYKGKTTKVSGGYIIDDTDKDNFAPMSECGQNSLVESFSDEDRIQALATFLECDTSEISNIYDYEYETPYGDYLVVDEDEGLELAAEDIRNVFDDIGLDSFTDSFKDWILANAIDTDWFDDAVREHYEFYVEDIENEASSMGYENRLIEELHDYGFISDDDFAIDEDGEPNLRELNDDVDIDDATERYIDHLVETSGDSVEYIADNFGWDWVSKVAVDNNLLDMDAIVDECIYMDGVSHFIARYDGHEHDLGNGLFAYRTN